MGLINSIVEWNTARQERHLSRMKESGHCPQCHGRGFHAYAGHEYTFHGSMLDCPGCEGTGSYEEWTSLQ
ncbi:methionine aminopeptidase [Bacillus sp. DJP31]|uniref:methionine aminopeptidase n=1 Tax=Bacillus sp. DJP31 TaxID=3409789 RepID=UPI003BB62207